MMIIGEGEETRVQETTIQRIIVKSQWQKIISLKKDYDLELRSTKISTNFHKFYVIKII